MRVYVPGVGVYREQHLKAIFVEKLVSELPSNFVRNTIKAILHELQMIGNNLNQIAYLANCGYFHEAADKIPAFQKQYYSVMESLQSFIEKPIVDMYVVEAGEWHSEM